MNGPKLKANGAQGTDGLQEIYTQWIIEVKLVVNQSYSSVPTSNFSCLQFRAETPVCGRCSRHLVTEVNG